LPARHNLALLLAEQKGREKEAIDLWRENLRQSADYLPSRLSLAEALARQGDSAAAADEYRKVLETKPDYVAARIALADVLMKTNDRSGALDQLRQVVSRDSRDPEIFERIGDLEAGIQDTADARTAYQSALDLKPDRAARNRIKNKLESLAGR
jgi:predicted negative regulator of RcsB-dependent stress response